MMMRTPLQTSPWGGSQARYTSNLHMGRVGERFVFCLIFLFIIFSYENLSSAPLPVSKTNIALTDSLTKSYIIKLADFLNDNKVYVVNFINNRTDETRYIEQFLLSEFKNKGIILTSLNADSVNHNLRIIIREFKIRYTNHEQNDDSLNREIFISLSSIITDNKTGIIVQGPDVVKSYNDVISRNDTEFIKNYEFKFTNPDVPERPGSWLRDIAQPIVFIAAAATTVVLLFTVRSK